MRIFIIIFIFASFSVIIIAFIFYQRRKQKRDLLIKVSEPEEYVGENIMFYDEEGAGEEDQAAYDISRLQKPVGGDDDSYVMKPIHPDDSPMRRDEQPYLGGQSEIVAERVVLMIIIIMCSDARLLAF